MKERAVVQRCSWPLAWLSSIAIFLYAAALGRAGQNVFAAALALTVIRSR